jgi:hypothetical protein
VNSDARVNPFATRYVQPGAIPWLAETAAPQPVAEPVDEAYFAGLVDRFENVCKRRGAIVGPHGTGKSTLLEHLTPRLGRVVWRTKSSRENSSGDTPASRDVSEFPLSFSTGRPVIWLSLRRDRRPFSSWLGTRRLWTKGSLLVIDGFEQMTLPGRWLVLRVNRFAQSGILLTSHRPMALTTLCWTGSNVAALQGTILRAFHNAGVSGEEHYLDAARLRELLELENGNIREVLMRLYDDFASRANAE